jgi:uncharacterized protein
MLGVGFMAHDKLLKEKRGAVMDMAARHGAKNIRVFGSVVRGQAGAESDIDLLVKMEEGRSLLDLSALISDLRELLGVKVDVVSEEGLYWLLRRRILKEARPL